MARQDESDGPAHALEEQLLLQAFARLRPVPLGVSLGLVGAAILFGATAILLAKDVLGWSQEPVGTHLALLGNYFPGYAVTWLGSILGLLYGFASGFVLGCVGALLVNFNHLVYMRLLLRRLKGRAIQDGL